MNKTSECLFCSIISKEIPAKIVAEDDAIMAFHDINPMAPVHLLIIPKIHVCGVNNLGSNNISIMGDLFMMAAKLARQFNVDKSGYRLVVNTEPGAGQSVFHLHVHLLAGREFSWPPG